MYALVERPDSSRSCTVWHSVDAIEQNGRCVATVNVELVGNCYALSFTKLNPEFLDAADAALSLCATTMLMNGNGLPFAPHGRGFNDERASIRRVGGVEQTIMVSERARLWGFHDAPTGAYVIDPTGPMEVAAILLTLMREGRIDSYAYKTTWMANELREMAANGMPPSNRPPNPIWVH